MNGMAAAVANTLSLEDFLEEYGGENGYEYWNGEVVRKGMGTHKHTVLARVIEALLIQHGYKGSEREVDLAIDPNWRPRPDVHAAKKAYDPYITEPVPVIEILSPNDKMSRVFKKCRNYARLNMPGIFVFDPESRDAWEWSRDTDNLERISEMRIDPETVIPVELIWREFEAALEAASHSD